ncbi:TPA: protein-disulfide reductase DsbD [Stenotrophomonas maltophilia]|jgi:thiol:disulfide interchange protein DsbD|uniref:protein-disulfide reductase DsbD n=1 Tax=Burkholderia sp. LMG 13014 TaxID=2709306 RepID=UPI0019669989|nr:protein-disulfide reductase DsbD [Burkholderia sp. LMG 13014]HDS1367954.1 protein-disulfide reductase DsbD [Stenotrophomonas maltophilia]HEJ3239995.1 protein-disulfide reductase DsbD [Pseudomonas aeruginosa]HDS1372568.1 protein-disulfide reductase DsbD [Stenotrophomonas maltophilia]HDS1376493.1 protein-disulfide reductase DsbD [Stenotrophomonas maltophilia]HDS1381347.1 protein-disulfide reductase DsbD [Stenotrophomonas maltophilia]
MLALVLMCCAAGAAGAEKGLFSWGNESEFLDAAEVFKLGEVRQQEDWIVVEGKIAEGHYLYRHALKLTDAHDKEVPLDLPEGTAKRDEFFGDTEIYTPPGLILRFPAKTAGLVKLNWQGCAEKGICYPPETIAVTWPANDSVLASPGLLSAPAALQTDGSQESVGDDQALAQRLGTMGPVSAMLLFLGFGFLLAFTPCTLPMIPIISTLVVGSQARPRRALALSLSYVLAMAATYAGVGVAAGLAGANFQAALQSPWLLSAFAVLFLILAVSLFGAFKLQLPSALVNRIESAGRGREGGSLAGAAVLGFLSALLVGPCMTAPLAGGLLYIGQTGSALTGGLVLFALGLGMGMPLLAIAVFGARILPKPGEWMDRVCVAFGYVMVGMAIMMLARFLPSAVSLLLWGALMLAVAFGLLGWANALQHTGRAVWALRFGAALTGVWSVLMLVGAASGSDSALQPLAYVRASVASSGTSASGAVKPKYMAAKSVEDVQARLTEASERGQWTLIDFYADWCVSCHVIERNVFGDPVVATRLAKMQVLRPDVTRNDKIDQALLKHWQVMGPPTLILVGPDGRERRMQRMVGEMSVRGFLERLDAAGTP